MEIYLVAFVAGMAFEHFVFHKYVEPAVRTMYEKVRSKLLKRKLDK